MKRKLGTLCMILGTVLIGVALSLFLWNQKKEQQAEQAVQEILPQMIECIEDTVAHRTEYPNLYDGEMTKVEIDGDAYIGYLSIPSMDVMLPVMNEWNAQNLETAPCRYAGSVKTNDMVIAAHNYASHFGKLKQLSVGDLVSFTDMDGVVFQYKVVETGVIEPDAIEKVTDSGFALTLFTCTYSGQNRIAVWCEKM